MKFQSAPIPEHEEAPLADGGRWEDLIARWAERQAGSDERRDGRNACYVVSISVGEAPSESALSEIVALIEAQGDRVAGSEARVLRTIDPRTLLGSGACSDIAEHAVRCGADLLVVDAELSPSQMRNLEDATSLPILDREGVILNVFLRHAKTKSSRIQIEIAQLEYLRPRIRGLGLDMDQQVGGAAGSRGPGETASELRARQLDGRLAELRKAFERIKRAGETQRGRRASCKRIALVGYTNAGKTSLMNALAGTDLSARDVPFETLDATSRCLTRHGGEVVLSDTVGFIRRLPDRLFASFASTLAEIREAALLVVVVDASDPERGLHVETTEAVLERLEAKRIPRFYVFNKVDRLREVPSDWELRALSRGHGWMALSARDKPAASELKRRLLERVHDARRTLFVPYAAKEIMAAVYARCRVVDAKASEDGLSFTLEGDPLVISPIEQALEERKKHETRDE